jgi:hypothetical protein
VTSCVMNPATRYASDLFKMLIVRTDPESSRSASGFGIILNSPESGNLKLV